MAEVVYAVVGKSDNKLRNIVMVDDDKPPSEIWKPRSDEIAVKLDEYDYTKLIWNGSVFTYTPPSPLTILEG